MAGPTDGGPKRLLLAQRLDGGFGLREEGEPSQGAIAGLAKTASREWPEVMIRAVDLHPAIDPFAAAELLAAELGADGPTEIGLAPEGRCGIEMLAVAAPRRRDRFSAEDLLLVSGGARGVTAEAAVRLAASGARRLILLGRSPAPEPEPEWLAGLDGEAAIKQALARRSVAKPTPKELQRQFQAIAAGREVRRTLERLAAAGAEAHYRAVDLRDGAAVAEALRELQATLGPITGLIHGAGVLADRKLEDLRREDFAAVHGAKVESLRHLLAGLDPERLNWLALFSSTTARLGRAGQAAYAMANEILNKEAQRWRRRWPHCRTQAVNWGPWAGGMVNASLAELFAKEGVGLIPMEAGAELLLEEMLADEPRPAELVVLAPPPAAPPGALRLMEVSLSRFPQLADHRLAGKPVVPLALALEWLAAEAVRMQPGKRLLGFDEVHVLKGMVLEGQPLRLELTANAIDDGRTRLGLRSHEEGAKPAPRAQATAVFGEAAWEPSVPTERPTAGGSEAPPDYGGELFHGPGFQVIDEVLRCDAAGISVMVRCVRRAFPMFALDAALQAFILWSQRQRGVPCLPTGFLRFRMTPELAQAERLTLEATAIAVGASQVRGDVVFRDSAGRCLGLLEGCESVADPALQAAFTAPAAAAAR